LWDAEVRALLTARGFRLRETEPFEFGLNRLYVAAKAGL
jgi:hypothetical protein